MKKINWISGLLLISASLFYSSAQAVLLSFSTTSNNVNVGDFFDVDIVASVSSGEIISTFDLDVLYDATVMNATSVLFGSFLDDSLGLSIQIENLSALGVVDLSEISLLSDSELEALQSGSFTLATLTFESLAIGNSTLTFDPADPFALVVGSINPTTSFPEEYSYADLTAQANNNPLEIASTAPTGSVPEPNILILLMTGLLGLGWVRRKKT